jgi:hypothetical protein
MKYVTLVSLLLVLVIVPVSTGQETIPDANDRWFNFSSSPLIFERARTKTTEKNVLIDLRNRSSKFVTDYDFGCVTQNGNSVTVVKRFWGSSITDGGMPPQSSWPAFGSKDRDKDESYIKSMCQSSKIAVVWVVFDGGTYWAAPGAVLVKRSY